MPSSLLDLFHQLKLTDGALLILAAVFGVVVARSFHKLALSTHPKIRIFLILSLLNASLLVLVWALPRAFGAHSSVITALTAPPPVFYLLPAVALLAASFVPRHRDMLPLNVLAVVLGLWAVMGFRFAVVAPPETEKPVKVMSWNLGGDTNDLHAVMAGIRQEHPDIVCLQEVPKEASLETRLPGYHWVEDRGLAIGAENPLDLRRTITLLDGERPVKAIEGSVDVHGRTVSVATARLTPDGSPHASDDRTEEATKLHEALHGEKGPVVLAAGFEAQPSSPACQLVEKDLLDSFDQAGSGFGYTAPNTYPVRRVDYIFASPGFTVKDAGSEKLAGSGHLPVVATIGFTKPKPDSASRTN